MKIGIFDSGIGGEAVAVALRHAFPETEMVVVNDVTHVPYGDRTSDDITTLTDTAIQPLLKTKCDIIIIACNSATAAAIETLRVRYPGQLFIGLEPMIKPAVEMTGTGVIAVCATPATLASRRYQHLRESFAQGITVLEPDCASWARMIEDNDVNEAHVQETIDAVCRKDADIIILACTHYHWIRSTIEKTADGRATVIDPSDAIVRRAREILERR